MYINLPGPIVKCSNCGSEAIEYVTRSDEKFKRCIACGHEGDRISTLPSTNSGSITSAIFKRDEPEVETF